MFSSTMTFDEAYEELGDQLDALYKDLRKSPTNVPPELFHYTTLEGLNGITETIRIWGSNVRFLNDLSEPKYAVDALKEGLEKVKCKHKAKREIEAKQLLGNFWNSAEQQYVREGPDAYVFCFCENGDLLSQWRGYSERGRGCALGFSSTKLLDILDRSSGQYLFRVIYDPGEQQKEIESAIGQVTDVLAELEGTVGPLERYGRENAQQLRRKIYSSVFAEIVRLQACFKNPAFQEEKEWRIVQFVPSNASKPPIRFRRSATGIVPYLEIDLLGGASSPASTLPLNSVVIGPTLDPVLTKEVLTLMFSQRGYKAVVLSESRVPFRL